MGVSAPSLGGMPKKEYVLTVAYEAKSESMETLRRLVADLPNPPEFDLRDVSLRPSYPFPALPMQGDGEEA